MEITHALWRLLNDCEADLKLLLKLVARFATPNDVAWLARQTLGTKRGNDALDHIAPILTAITTGTGLTVKVSGKKDG